MQFDINSAGESLSVRYTVFPDVSALSKQSQSDPWPALVKRLSNPETYGSKRECPLIKLAEFGVVRTDKGSYRSDANVVAVYGIEGDYDGGDVSPLKAADMLREANVAAVIYTTPSHTPTAPRWRVVSPLSTRRAAEDRTKYAAILNAILGGILAPESFNLSQSFYFGQVAGAHFESHCVTGDTIDGSAELFFEPLYPQRICAAPAGDGREPFNLVTREADRLRATEETISELESALLFLASKGIGNSYDDWLSNGQALASLKGTRVEHLARCAWIKYCQACEGYESEDAAGKKWDVALKGERSSYPAIFKRAQEAGWNNPRTTPRTNNEDSPSDVHLSRMLADVMSERYLYVKNGLGWMVYRGGAWERCSRSEEVEEAKALGDRILAVDNPEQFGKATKLAKRAKSAGGISAALQLAQADPRIAASPEEFDRDPDLLNVLNGVVYLPTGELFPHEPKFRMGRQCPIPYISDSDAPRWKQFLIDISHNDAEWVDFLHRAIGYSISGHVREEVLFFLLGWGANGKSVLANVMRRILGTYSTSVPPGFLMVSQRDGESATPSLAVLPGARLALANEVEAGSRLSAQTVKIACSTETIAARPLYGDVFNFVPTHKLWIRGNHKPIVTDNDEGIWRRLLLVPFERHFMQDERDPDLEAKLMSEAPGILRWMIRGYGEYLRRGLKPSKRIAGASAEYRKESDLMGQWLADRAESGPAFECPQVDAYNDYRGWCSEQGLRPVAKKSFTRGLIERGVKEGRRTTGRREHLYKGFQLLQSVPHVPDDWLFA